MIRPSTTAYPRLKYSISAEELYSCYTPSHEERSLAETSARGASAKLGFLLLLKTSQTLGRFVASTEIPQVIIDHIATFMNLPHSREELDSYNQSGTRKRHIRIIRKNRGLKPFDLKVFKIAENAVRNASVIRDDVIDLINIAIEELVKNSCELPVFKSLLDLAQAERKRANQDHIETIFKGLNKTQKSAIDQTLRILPEYEHSEWNQIKQDPGNPSTYHLKDILKQLKTGDSIGLQDMLFEGIPLSKLNQFAADAKTLDISRMKRMESKKKYALAACLFRTQKSRALDDIGEMVIRCMQKVHTRAKGSLENYLRKYRGRTDQLISKLENIALAANEKHSDEKLGSAVKNMLAPSPYQILMECREHLAYKDSNHFPFLWCHFKNQRSVLFQALESLDIRSTSQDDFILSAIKFICQNKLTGKDWLPTCRWNGNQVEYLVDLSWIPDDWYKLVTGEDKKKSHPITKIDRRNFEVCVFSHIMWELKSGDLFIVGSQSFSDFRKQFITWEEYRKGLPQYLAQVGLPANPAELIEQLKNRLTKAARETDQAFPASTAIKFINGRPVLTKFNRKRTPQQLAVLEAIIESRMPRVSILDALADTFRWVGLSKFFRPLSGQMSRLDDLDLEEKHISTLFCYGCNLGPAQTVRSLKNSNRKQLVYFHQRHFTESRIYKGMTAVINEYNRFDLPKCWGSGKSASADGTKWDLYEQNLLSEYHIRYGGYGGIGYYHTSDTYIALFSHFIPCGVREAVYVLDGLLKNESDIQPDTIYGDSHAQSATAFGLSLFLGINLMPRIKSWKKLTLYKSAKKDRYQHIEPLFSGEVIDWKLIETHLPDMLRVAMSVKEGKLNASTILKRLGSYSRKNRLYFAFREIGRAVRTIFLLNYISDPALRSLIQGGINKSEGFNYFTQWVAFGGDGVIAENDREQQRKIIAYNHLVSNCIIFHTINGMTNVIQELIQEGFPIDRELLSCLSPFITKHINRFGDYNLDLKRKPSMAKYDLILH